MQPEKTFENLYPGEDVDKLSDMEFEALAQYPIEAATMVRELLKQRGEAKVVVTRLVAALKSALLTHPDISLTPEGVEKLILGTIEGTVAFGISDEAGDAGRRVIH